MKNSLKRKLLIFASVMVAVAALISVLALNVFADAEPDAMIEIREAFDENYKVGESYTLQNDGYLGIEVEFTTYYDASRFGTAKSGYRGTNVAIYFVNTKIDRVGTESDVNIISELLSRGFAVVTADYKNNSKAKSQDLDWSSQEIRKSVLNGNCFTDKTVFPSGTYKANYVVPAGYSVTPFENFWSIDEHGADGTLEKIVEIWNYDFRATKGNVVVDWTRTETDGLGNEITVQKPTQNGFDGSKPQWYSDENGANPTDESSPDAKYIRIMHTLAEEITDCTAKDGTPISLDIDMHIVYPVNPEKAVPVIMQSGSSEYLTTASTGSGTRPHHNGYLFRGYAGIIYDHIYTPMAYDEYYGYFDGSQANSVSGDHVSYTLYSYNSQRVDTAAVRYVRYLAYTQPEKYSFDTEHIGVFGNSKGGMFMFIGSAELREYTEIKDGMTLVESIDARINSYIPSRLFVGHYGETRYQNGITEDYTVGDYTIRGGKPQPWTTYIDSEGVEREILAYTSYIYAGNGGNVTSMTEGHAAIFNVMCLDDPLGNAYDSSNKIAAAAKDMNVACLSFVAEIAHTFAYGPDLYYNVDTYEAMFAMSDYYLKNAAVKVIYTDPVCSLSGMDTTAPITIKFSGAVAESELSKITLCDSNGNAVDGIWKSCYGNTEWKFVHDVLLGNEKYTLTVPAGFMGENETPTKEAYVATYITRNESTSEPVVIKTENGTYITVAKKDLSTASGAKLRFLVSNDAANTVSVTEVASFDAASPDSSVLGRTVGSVRLYGTGYYEIDISDSMASVRDGETKTFLIKTERTVAVTDISNINFGTSTVSVGNGKYSISEKTVAPDGNDTPAVKVTLTTNVAADGTSMYAHSEYYTSFYTILSNAMMFPKITEDDLGRKYTITLKVFDTISRQINLRFNNATSAANEVLDFDYPFFTTETKANEWTEITFDYTVLDPLYGATALYTKRLNVHITTDGIKQSPIYIAELSAKETVTDVQFKEIHLALYDDGTKYKANASDMPFSIGTVGYASLSAALGAAKSGDTVVANANYTVTEGFGELEKLTSVTLELSGYKLYMKGTAPLITAKATMAASPSEITVKNGAIYIDDSALVSYSGSTSSGSGKSFRFNFSNVSFVATDLAMARNLITENTVSNVDSLDAEFIFDFCTFRIEKNRLTKNPITLLPDGEGALDINYTLCGGSIVLDSMVNVTLWDSYKTVTLSGEKENHTILKIPAVRVVKEIIAKSDSVICSYTLGEEKQGIATYVTKENKNSTPYGIIPVDYENEQVYPFVAFDKDGNCLGGFTVFAGENGGAFEKARGFLEKNNSYNNGAFNDPDATVYIVARRDYELASGEYFNNTAQFQGTVVVDLGGNTLSQGSCSNSFFRLASKKWSSAPGEKIFPATVKVLNGELRVTKNAVITMDVWDSGGDGAVADKIMNLIFNDVTFGFASGATMSRLIGNYKYYTWSPTTVASQFNVVFNDCVFDYETVAPSGKATLFNTDTTDQSSGTKVNTFVDVDYVINGGLIRGGAFSNITIADNTGSFTSSVLFGKGSDGQYTKLEVNKGVSVPAGNYTTVDGKAYGFSKESSTESKDVYALAVNPLITKYGVISDKWADAEKYPFVLFDGNGNCLYGFETWMGSTNETCAFNYIAYKLTNKNAWNSSTGEYTKNGGAPETAIIYMRRDYAMSSADKQLDNVGHIQGEVLVDLGGHKLSQGTSSYNLFRLNAKGWSSAAGEKMFPTTINVINGTLLVYKSGLVYTHTWDSTSGFSVADKRIEINFNGVTVGLENGATATAMMLNAGCYQTSVAAQFNVNFNDCVFDLETVAPAGAFTVFSSYTENNYCKVLINVNGGEFKFGSKTNITLSKTNGAYGSYNKFGEGAQGNYPTLSFIGTTVTSETLNTDEGSMKFVKMSAGKYILASVSNPYNSASEIPQEYGYAEKYPFIVLDQNGNYIGAYEKLYGANSDSAAVGHKLAYTHLTKNGWDENNQKWLGATTACTVLLRRDYTLGTDEYFNNWGHVQGSVTIDLCGYSITQQSGSKNYALFNLASKGWNSASGAKVFPTTITVKNGSIDMYSTSLISMNCYDSVGGGAIANKKFTFNLENVKVGLSRGATLTNLLLTTNKADTTSGVAPFFINFNDCEFDLLTNSNGKTVKLFNNDASADKYVSCDMRINGGVVKVNKASLVDLYYLNTTGTSTIAFAKGTDGYLKIVLPSGESAPTMAVPTANGNYKFVKTADDGSFVTYELAEDALTSFVPKVSLTLYSDFAYNIYVPVRDFIKLVKINGEAVTLTEDMITEVDGVPCYKITKTLAAKEAATDFTLTVTVELNDGRTASAKWTLGILKYLDKLLTDSSISKEERALAEDILVYIKTAYAYFNMEDAKEVGDRVDSILGKEGVVDANVTGEAVNTTEGLASATVVLGAEVAFKFTPADPADADKFVFTQNGRALKSEIVTEDGKTYILVTTYAYGITDTVSYTAQISDNVTYSGSFNLKAYYDYAVGQSMTDVAEMVRALWQYSESAEAYRASVAG